MQTQTTENRIDSKCARLVSPRRRYDRLLVHLYEEFDEERIKLFQLLFRDALPSSTLEEPNPLNWFCELERRRKLSWRNVDSLSEFLEDISHNLLLSKVCNYQAIITITQFFLKNLQQKLPQLCLDSELDRKWKRSEEEQVLPESYSMKCNELLCGEQNCDVHCLFSKGFHLLVDSCRSCNDDAHLACLKLLYLANLFYNRFKEMVVKSPQLLKFKPLPDGECFCGNRQRTPVTSERRNYELVHQHLLSHRYGSSEVVSMHGRNLIFCLIASLFGVLPSLIGMFGICTCKFFVSSG